MLTVTLSYQKARHINQYLYGFLMLQQAGVLRIEKIIDAPSIKKNILRAEINGVKLVYDAFDGSQQERGFFSVEDYAWCDRYYKRSYGDELAASFPKCFPLGFNYSLTPCYGTLERISQTLRRLRGKGDILHSDLEARPALSRQPKILFITGLWDPAEFSDPQVQQEVEQLTCNRLAALHTVGKYFSHCATFGISGNREFTRKRAANMILPEKLTHRPTFLRLMKQHDICITTTGLHGSVGGRFGEFLAASRAIISEPLHYRTTGNFSEGKNFLRFTDEESLYNAIDRLLSDSEARMAMMQQNHHYYQNWLRPDQLILHTLESVPA